MASKTLEYERLGNGPMFGEKTLHDQSHGESFLNFITSFKQGLFIMDEPEAALSPNRQLTLFSQIAQMAREGSQYIIVTHSPILLALPGADILQFDGKGIHSVEYEQTESYRITELFVNHREAMVQALVNEGV